MCANMHECNSTMHNVYVPEREVRNMLQIPVIYNKLVWLKNKARNKTNTWTFAQYFSFQNKRPFVCLCQLCQWRKLVPTYSGISVYNKRFQWQQQCKWRLIIAELKKMKFKILMVLPNRSSIRKIRNISKAQIMWFGLPRNQWLWREFWQIKS